jgi:mono/diheme cytochrome c family protein
VAMMRGTPGMRWTFAILSPIFLLTVAYAVYVESNRPWQDLQEQFTKRYTERATKLLHEAEARKAAPEETRWKRILDELGRRQPALAQIYIEELQVVDRCPTCHQAIENPLFENDPHPFRTHPAALLKQHELNRFGCTPCHDGQGLATTVEGAHGRSENWPTPLLPTAYLQATCARCHEVTYGLEGADLLNKGDAVFMTRGCYGCHDVPGVTYLPKYSPPLGALKSKLADPASYVFTVAKDPTRANPDAAMPQFFLSDEEAGKIAAFLMSLPSEPTAEPVDLSTVSVADGERLFKERGCRACHSVKVGEVGASPRVPNLAFVGSKVTTAWLDRWLKDPKGYNPDTAMPRIELTDSERLALVAYLATLKRTEPLDKAPDLSRFDPNDGKTLVKNYECFGCHAIPGFEKSRPAVPDLSDFARRPVDELDFANTTDVPRTKWDWLRRKLVDPRAYNTDKISLKMPRSKLTDEETQALVVRVLGFAKPDLPARYTVAADANQRALHTMRLMIDHLNCRGCHKLDGQVPHVAQFYERKNMVPPSLEGVGARLQGQYTYNFVLKPQPVRPWLTIRMPTFGFTELQAQTLVHGLAMAAGVTNPYSATSLAVADQQQVDRGRRRFRHFKCAQCHPTQADAPIPEGVDPEDVSINLNATKTRLRPEWIRKFLAKPKELVGNDTRMPTVFYTVDGTPKVDHPDEDIIAITAYMMSMADTPEPEGEAGEEEAPPSAPKNAVDWSNMQY